MGSLYFDDGWNRRRTLIALAGSAIDSAWLALFGG
jgi:hypothetical protein